MHWTIAVLIVVGCLIAWKLTSKDMHDRSHPKYSAIDHYGWWFTTVVLAIVGLAFLIFA